MNNQPPTNHEPGEHELAMRAQHRNKYESLAQQIGIEELKDIVAIVASPDVIRRALEHDRNLNNIRLARWDAQHPAVVWYVRRAGGSTAIGEPGGWSLANSVCVLKHVAKYHVAGWTAQQDDESINP